ADHVRSAIVYTHLNPWRAGLCDAPHAYAWTSHGAYLPGANPAHWGIHTEAQEHVLNLFADLPHLTRDALAERYLVHVNWRMLADRYRADLEAGRPVGLPPPQPVTVAGDWAWSQLFPAIADGEADVKPLPDLRDFITALLRARAPGTTIAELRGPWRPRNATRLRASLIRTAAERGFRTGEIARFFAVSPALVSSVKFRQQ